MTRRLPWDLHIPAPVLKPRFTFPLSVSMLMLPLQAFLSPFRAFEAPQNIVTLASETLLSSQKLNPVFLNGRRYGRACATEQN